MARKKATRKVARQPKAARPQARALRLTGAYAALGPGDIKKVIQVHLHGKPRCQGGNHDDSCEGKAPIDFCRVVKFPMTTCVCTHPKLGE